MKQLIYSLIRHYGLQKGIVAFAFSIIHFVSFSQQVIEVGGIIRENTYWTSDNLYLVTDNIRVLSGAVLSIQPGTIVKFNQGRGLSIENGKLHAIGNLADSIHFVPNHTENDNWNWSGITISSINEPGSVIIEYVRLEKAVYGIRAISSSKIIIRNSFVLNNLFIGISLTNSSFCQVENNHIIDNFLGLEIHAIDPGNVSSDNLVANNKLKNHTTNLIIHNNNHGSCPDNSIEENLIKGGLHGIWLSNSALGGSGHAHVNRNIIISNGSSDDGFGIHISMDSTVVSNNIFWQNTTAIDFAGSDKSHFLNNSLYANKKGVIIRDNSSNITLMDNTITGNESAVLTFMADEAMVFSQNNIFNNIRDTALIKNLTPSDIDISHSFWNTTSDSIIVKLLFDKNVNPDFGLLNYQPVLSEPNLSAPVSPPHNFTSQLINGKLRFTWNANPESNLIGYRIYSGKFRDYGFSDSTGLITDTIYFIEGQSIDDLAAITALNTSGLQPQAQLYGYESPFAFVTSIPYAGTDTTICIGNIAFSIGQSTIPSDFDSIYWQSSGDGYFSDPVQLRPLYFPGEADLENEGVRLTLFGFRNMKIYSHSHYLGFSEPPSVDTGPDAIIATDSIYYTHYASAKNYDHLLWETTGDGSFSQPDSLITTYTPGPMDISQDHVYLVLKAFSQYCDMVSDTLKLLIRQSFIVEGRVWAGNQPLNSNPVIAIKLNQDLELPTRRLSFTDDEGKFRFNNIFIGEYIFYAPADTTASIDYLPSYHAGRTRWQSAYVHNMLGNTYEIDIRLPQIMLQLPKGNGSISGHFSLPGNISAALSVNCNAWFGDTVEQYCVEGLPNVSILLFSLNRQRIYGHTLTGANGNFSFRELPYGTYILEAEIAAYESAVSAELIISPQQESIAGIILEIETENKISITIPENPSKTETLLVHPNPASDFLNLTSGWFDDQQTYEIVIYDLPGSAIKQLSVIFTGAGIRIETRSLKKGLYFGKICDSAETRYFRFIKNQ